MQTKYSTRKYGSDVFRSIKVGEIDYNNKEGIKNLIGWLLGETKPI